MTREISNAIIKRILTSVTVLILVVTFVFFLIRLAPGTPTQKYLSPDFSPKLSEQISKSFNLDESYLEQYMAFIGNLFSGDLGSSYTYRLPVTHVVIEYLSFTILFALLAFIIQTVVSFWLAIKASEYSDNWFDKAADKISLIIYTSPSFVVGLFLVLVFSVHLNLVPTSGIKSLDQSQYSFFGRIADYAKHLVLPLITLSAGGIAVFYRYLRDNMKDIYNQNFILNLRSMGINESEILKKHVLPNTVGPFLSIAGVELGILFGGALITEVIFGLPGMGRLTISAILERDYPLVIGCTLAAALLMILSNLMADIVKIRIDKRLVKDLLQ